MRDLQPLFDQTVAEVEAAYTRLGHRMGWRFLLTPRSTFIHGARVLLLSFHPGGDREYPEQSRASSDAGSAYDLESWGGSARGSSPLQVQVRAMLEAFGEPTGRTLSAYFVPFRAPDSASMTSARASRAFAIGLWARLLPEIDPSVVITLGEDTYSGVGEALGAPTREIRRPAGWGKLDIVLGQFGKRLVVRIPHLSQFKLMSRAEGRQAVADVAGRVASFRAGRDWTGEDAGMTPAAPLPPLAPATRTRLEKAALDNGFDRELAPVGCWLAFGSSHAPLDVWLGALATGHLAVALSRADVARGLTEHGRIALADPPAGVGDCLDVETVPDLNRLLRRAYQLARTLPHQLLHEFEQKAAGLPRATEAERLVVQRIGQDVFRAGLMEYWDGKCAITGLEVPELLRAGHIKPWAACESDAERLDVFNGLLLAPHLDAAFDRGLITFTEEGDLLVASSLPDAAAEVLGLDRRARLRCVAPGHTVFLRWHREHLFKGPARLARDA